MSPYFFISYLAYRKSNLMLLLRRQSDSPDMLITIIYFLIRPEGHREPYNEFWSQLSAERTSAAIPIRNIAL